MHLLSCGSYCFVLLPHNAVDLSVVVVYTGHPHLLSEKTMKMYR